MDDETFTLCFIQRTTTYNMYKFLKLYVTFSGNTRWNNGVGTQKRGIHCRPIVFPNVTLLLRSILDMITNKVILKALG